MSFNERGHLVKAEIRETPPRDYIIIGSWLLLKVDLVLLVRTMDVVSGCWSLKTSMNSSYTLGCSTTDTLLAIHQLLRCFK